MKRYTYLALLVFMTSSLWAGYVAFPPATGGGGGGGGTSWDGASTLATPLTGFSSAAGGVTSGDTILSAFNKVDGNIAGVSTFFGGSLLAKEDVVNKDTDVVLLANSDTRYPSQRAIKTYVDNNITGVSTFATAQLLLKEDVINKSTDGTMALNSDVLYPSQKATSTFVHATLGASLLAKEDVINKSTDGTFASNSDVLYPSQKAAKTYVDTTVGASVLKTPDTFAAFGTSGVLETLTNWSVNKDNGNYGAEVYNTVSTPADAGNVTHKFQSFETEIAAPQDTTQYTAYGFSVDTHHDRGLSGYSTLSIRGLNLNTEHAGSGVVTGMEGIYSSLQIGTGNGGSVLNSTHLDLETNIGAGGSTQNYQGIRTFVNVDPLGNIANGQALTLSLNGNASGNWRGMEHIVSGQVGGDINSIIDNITGDAVGSITSYSSGISGDAANVTSFNANQSGTYDNAAGLTIGMSSNPSTGNKTGVTANLNDGDASSATIFSGSIGNATIATTLTGLNIQHVNSEPVNENGVSVALSSGTTKTNSNGILVTAAGTQTNLQMLGLNGTATATTVSGINLDLSNITSVNKKTAIQSVGGGLDMSYAWNTTTTPSGGTFQTHNLASDFTITSGSPITAAGPFTPPFGFGTNLNSAFTFNDDYDADFTGARFGYSLFGMFAGIEGSVGATVDMFNANLAAAYVKGGTGGTITDANMFRTIGIVPSVGTPPTITNMTAFLVDPVYDAAIGTNKWGFKSDSTTADNWFGKNVVVGGSTKQPTNASVGIEVAGTTKALLLSRLTTAERTALTAVAGMQVYDTDLGAFYCYTTAWAACGGGGASTFAGGWSTLGNAGLDDTVNFVGTTDGVDLVLRTNNTEAMRIDSATNFVGVSTISPTAELDVNGNARVRYLNTAGVVTNDASGNLSTTAVLPIARGGTNSSTALNNNRVVVSSAGAIVEHTALTADRVLYTDGSGLPAASTVTATELGYLSGVTSSIQTQFDAKKATFTVYSEAPAGVVDGVNVTFTPPHMPTETASFVLSIDGAVASQEAGSDGYTVGGSTITLGTAPAVGQKLWLIYH